MRLSEANSLAFEEFVDTFKGVVEQCPIVAAAIWDARPFKDISKIQESIEAHKEEKLRRQIMELERKKFVEEQQKIEE